MTVSQLVGEFMSVPVHTIRDTKPIDEIQEALARHQISCLPVVDVAGHVVGIVSRFNLLRVGRLRARTGGARSLLALPRAPVGGSLRHRIHAVTPETSIRDAARTMCEERIHRVLVLDAGRLVGVLGTRELMRAAGAARIDTPLHAHHTTPLLTAQLDEPIAIATDRLGIARVTGLVVVDDGDGDGRPVGLFADREALAARNDVALTPVEDVMSSALLCMPLGTPLHEAAEAAWTTKARRILTVEGRQAVGIVTGLDFAQALCDL